MPLEQRVEEFVASLLGSGFSPRRARGRKVIHDAVWGTNVFYQHEIAVIDSPIMQRLRWIAQTGLAYLTYPSARHSRFEHSLGVCIAATRFAARLNESSPRQLIGGDPERDDLAEIRMAGILHDVGHGFFSHASEEVYRWNPNIAEYLRRDQFANANAQEVLSYIIIRSTSFRRFFEEALRPYPCRIDIDNVASIVLGRHTDPERQFIAEIINGPFDADKLDYLARDAHFSGLNLPVDIDRLFYTASTHRFPDNRVRLIVNSATPVEHLLFSKMMLNASLYHHQKVRAAECYLRGIIELASTENASIGGRRYADPVSLLSLTDNDLLNGGQVSDNDDLKSMASNLLHRNLPMRAAVLSKTTIEDYDERVNLLFRMAKQHPDEMLRLRRAIQERLPSDHRCSIHEIIVDLPKLPTLKEASQTYVQLFPDSEPVPLSQVFPLEGWLKAYGLYRWRGHIFCPARLHRQVFDAARDAFAELEPVPIELNDRAWQLAQAEEQLPDGNA